MKHCFLVILFLSVARMEAQDRFLKKDLKYDTGYNVSFQEFSVHHDALWYVEGGELKNIPADEVIAIKRNYLDPLSTYVYLRPKDERIYGISNDRLFLKSDYEYDLVTRKFAMSCFLDRFRVYDSLIPKDKKGRLYLENTRSGRKKRVQKNIKICFSLKEDKQKRKFIGRVYNITKDSSLLIMQVQLNGEKHVYAFKNEDISMIGMELPVVFLTRHTLALVSLCTVIFAPMADLYYDNKWYRKYSFNKWHLSK